MNDALIRNLKAGVLFPLLDIFWPQGIFISICRFALLSPLVTYDLVSSWILSGYIDSLAVSDTHTESVASLVAYLGTLLCRNALKWSVKFVLFAILSLWDHPGTTVATVVTFGLFLNVCPRSILNPIVFWMEIVPMNLIYGFFVILGMVWGNAQGFLTFVVRLIGLGLQKQYNRSSSAKFTYAQAPAFDNPRTQLRLLKLHRRIPFSTLSGELLSFELSDAPTYYAVSYVWGHGPQDMQSMKLNGMDFDIKGNVHQILQRCSSFSREHYIWIDTICIDQSNVQEKTEQVRSMRDIYSRSEHVLICLGEGNAVYAMILMRELLCLNNLCGNEFVLKHVVNFLHQIKYDLLLRARIKGLVDLLRHPWFRRVWVVQEVVVAPRATFFYGSTFIQWFQLHEWLQVIVSGALVPQLAMFSDEQQDLQTAGQSFLGILSMPFIVGYQVDYKTLGAKSLSHVLRIFGEKIATQPIDKVFALIGIAERDPRLTQLIDYEPGNTTDALLKLALYFLINGEALDLIDLAGIGWGERDQGLPSWAVDWTTMRAGFTLKRHFGPPEVRYWATKDRTSSVTKGSSHMEILVRGEYVDQIKVLAPLAEMSNISFYYKMAQELAQRHAQDPYPYPGDQPLEEAIWRTLIGDRSNSTRPAPSFFGEALKTMMETTNSFGRNVTEIRTGMSMEDLGLDDIEARFGEIERLRIRLAQQIFQDMDLLFDIGEGVTSCVFCVTEKGYIGMVPQRSHVGDKICLIFGLEMPYVLRRLEGTGPSQEVVDKYKLVGGSYIHGIMDGEALTPEGFGEEFILV